MTKPQITFQTVKGAVIELTASFGVDARVISRDDLRFSGTKLVDVSGHGLCVQMGPIKAQIRAEDVAAVKAFFEAEEKASKDRAAAYLNSDEYKADAFSSSMRARMYGRNSDH